MIQVQNLTYTYPGSKNPVLRELNFDISEGEIFGFLGPSGAGKSTTQKVLYRILHNYKGDITVNNKQLDHWGKEYFEQIGVGFELPNHYLKLTGKENLELFATFYKKDQLLPIPELFEIVGLEESLNQKVETYSKGMKVRLNFIRALMHDPEMYYFDEPTAGLDPGNAFKIKEHILSLKKRGKTIFITTHNMHTADELCNRVSFIVDGRLQVTEKPSVLKKKYGKDVVKVELKDARSQEFPLQGLGENPAFLSFLREGELLRINTMEATLEEVFLKITGKVLEG